MTTTTDTVVPAALPPYSGNDTVCPKCAYTEAITRYRRALASHMLIRRDSGIQQGPLPERLERECLRCDYAWDEALAADVQQLRVDQVVHALQFAIAKVPSHHFEAIALGLLERFHMVPRSEPPVSQPDEEPSTGSVLPEPAEAAP
ncbi:hypothetical protein ABZ312_09815 [Streptomyces sp. NPDC006207]